MTTITKIIAKNNNKSTHRHTATNEYVHILNNIVIGEDIDERLFMNMSMHRSNAAFTVSLHAILNAKARTFSYICIYIYLYFRHTRWGIHLFNVTLAFHVVPASNPFPHTVKATLLRIVWGVYVHTHICVWCHGDVQHLWHVPYSSSFSLSFPRILLTLACS